MPRLSEARPPAEPSSKLQQEKYLRMLDAATELGTVNDLDHVQMLDVAKRAGVAIGTLYRYFPSKTHLFAAVMSKQIGQMRDGLERRGWQVESPVDSAADVLIRALRALLRRPLLATSMIRALNAANSSQMADAGRIDNSFQGVLLAATKLDRPTPQDRVIIRLVVQQWFAIVQSCLNGHIDVADAESDVRLACKLLLAPLSTVAPHEGR